MTTTQPRKLVRLRTAPMPDPGEWCDRCPGMVLDHTGYYCALDHCIPDWRPGGSGKMSRPRSCIDAAEEVET